MIVDAHYHLDPRLEPLDRLVAETRSRGIDRVALIPTMCDPLHVGRAGRAFTRWMRRALAGAAPRIGRALYRTTLRPRGRVAFLGPSSAVYARPDHADVERALALHPDRFVAWAFVNPGAPGGPRAVDEAERRLRQPGFIGVKAHPYLHRFPVRALDDVAALCAERGRPLLVHLGAGRHRGDFARLPSRFPRLRLVYAHAGIPFYRALWEDAARRENVFVDLSSPYLDRRLRAEAVRTLGAARCLHGTDGPYGHPGPDGRYDHGAILGQIERLGLSERDRERVLGGNFNALTAA